MYKSIQALEVRERSLHCTPESAFLHVVLFLLSGKRMIPFSLIQNAAEDAVLPEYTLPFVIRICLVGKYRPLIPTHQFVKLHGIMYTH